MNPNDKSKDDLTIYKSEPPPPDPDLIELTVIVPARNEADCIGACLNSLVSQSEDFFALGRDWEILVVDDGSTDQTRKIALSIPGVTVIDPNLVNGKLEKGWTGKANACWTAAQQARGRWLLFTDADTVHESGNLRRAIHEAEKYQVGMLSYSPRQLVSGLWQRALMPLVFCELALAYPPEKVSNPELRIAAAACARRQGGRRGRASHRHGGRRAAIHALQCLPRQIRGWRASSRHGGIRWTKERGACPNRIEQRPVALFHHKPLRKRRPDLHA